MINTEGFRNKHIIMMYINKLKDKGMRKVMLLKVAYNKTSKEIGKILQLREDTVDKIGRKGAILVQRMMYETLTNKGVIIGQSNAVPMREMSS